MIKANELRIGNWINLDIDNGREHLIEPCQIHTIGLHIIKINGGIHAKHTDFNPIPLTPEILERAGFVHIPDIVDGYTKQMIEGFSMDYCFPIEGGGDDGVYFIRFALRSAYRSLRTKKLLAYVHQLQNLWFAINGEELEINLIIPHTV